MNNRGFTLIEVITVLVLMGILVIPASNYVGLVNQYSFAKKNMKNATEVQNAISRISSELKTAPLDSIVGTYTPGAPTTRSVRFDNKLSKNREIRENTDGIYLYDGTAEYPLLKTSGPNTVTLTINYIDTSDNSYASWASGTSPGLKLVEINIEINRDDLDTPLTFTTNIFPRG